MRTISTLCASSAAVSVSAVGLAFARVDGHETTVAQRPATTPSPMTELAPHRLIDDNFRPSHHQKYNHNRRPSYRSEHALHADRYAHLAASTPDHDRFAGERKTEDGRESHSAGSRSVAPKRSLQLSRRGSSRGEEVERARRTWDEDSGSYHNQQQPPSAQNTLPVTPSPQTQGWLRRRLSSNMSGSRESSRTPSRPGSAMLSHSNGSFSFSQAGSTTPIIASQTPPPLPPNKLVKRETSLRGTNGSPGSASKLPLPVLRRPATSHQRSSMLRDNIPSYVSSNMSLDDQTDDRSESQWRHYFTPRVAGDRSIRRPLSSSGIPHPIRRIYPDRRYTPMLISSTGLSRRASVAFDDGLSDAGDDSEAVFQYTPSSAPATPALFGDAAEVQAPRRSFSIGDLLSTGPQPLWRRPSSSRGKSSLSRRSRSRVVSMPVTRTTDSLIATPAEELERPAKRRDLSGSRTTSRSIHSSSSGAHAVDRFATEQHDLPTSVDLPSTRSPPSASQYRATSATHFAGDFPEDGTEFITATLRPARLSTAQSEPASTVGSESEIRSLGDTSTDYQSDHVFDSIPTRATGSSGRRGPHIETIFDDSPPTYSSGRSNKLRDFLNESQTPGTDHNARYRHSTIEEEGSVLSTPVRSAHTRSVTSTPSARPGATNVFSSSPPMLNITPSLDDLNWDEEDDDAGEVFEAKTLSFTSSAGTTPSNKVFPFRFGPALRFAAPNSVQSTPLRNGTEKANPFDWSEPQPSPGQLNASPPRPKTVHGKKDQDLRGSRSAGRRAPSAMHARSHSVPVAPDTDGKRTNMVANKFGTWGVGSKGVTEDWDEDFDFGGPVTNGSTAETAETNGKRVDSGRDFDVPQRVKASQENVVANIGLLREWGLLIEELKELRIRAVALGMLQGPHAQSWREVDAMIELADQETEEKTLEPRRSPPSSPGFDYDAFEDTDFSREPSLQLSDAGFQEPETPQSTVRIHSRQSTPVITRPRKDSELVAQSVIAALQSKRDVSDSATPLPAASRNKKVPFDTATLRHIVPYVNTLKRKVKDALRETEGLYTSPSRRLPGSGERRSSCSFDDEPSFRSIFQDSGSASATRMHTPHTDDAVMRRHGRRERDYGDPPASPTLEAGMSLAARMQRMNLPAA